MAMAGAGMIDGAISGIPAMVAERKGVVYASGLEAEFTRAEPIILGFANKVIYFGPFGTGTKAKLTTNLLLALNIAASAEALAFGIKAGLPVDRLITALGEGAASSLQFKVRAPMMVEHDWDHRMGPTWMLQKDLQLVQALGRALECPIPLLDQAACLYRDTVKAGLGDADVAAIFSIVTKRAGLP
jgi:3-hydroxyisobutyrate dehydrogenase-like beta-hydroxyacid dehydrogenase